MKLLIVTIITFCLILVVNVVAFGETKMMVVNKRYIVPNTSIKASFYKNKDKPVTFEVSVPGRDIMEGMAQGGTKYSCPEMKWDWSKIEAASQKFADLLNSAKPLDEKDFLKDAGFGKCE